MFGIRGTTWEGGSPVAPPPPLIEKGENSGKWGKYIISDIVK